jgi:hypothetical protein
MSPRRGANARRVSGSVINPFDIYTIRFSDKPPLRTVPAITGRPTTPTAKKRDIRAHGPARVSPEVPLTASLDGERGGEGRGELPPWGASDATTSRGGGGRGGVGDDPHRLPRPSRGVPFAKGTVLMRRPDAKTCLWYNYTYYLFEL